MDNTPINNKTLPELLTLAGNYYDNYIYYYNQSGFIAEAYRHLDMYGDIARTIRELYIPEFKLDDNMPIVYQTTYWRAYYTKPIDNRLEGSN